MKSDCVKKVVSENRKIRKPLMEKKRRARINDSLETLKQILLESKTTLKESTGKKAGQRTAKLEKADILEMTVKYVQYLHTKLSQTRSFDKNTSVDISDDMKIGVTLIPTKLKSGEIVFVVPSNVASVEQTDKGSGNVWRPW